MVSDFGISRSSKLRRQVAAVICLIATAQASGLALTKGSTTSWNDVSRWCTVWSLLERGTYAIDECPWLAGTGDKVLRPAPFKVTAPGQVPTRHYYSSKPPFLPTLVAGVLAPARWVTGIPLDQKRERVGKKPFVVAPFYIKPIVLLFNIVPFGAFVFYYSRLLDRLKTGDWAWIYSLVAGVWGTQLMAFTDALTNHTLGAFCGFFATYAAILVWQYNEVKPRLFATAGLFAALAACNEMPAALLLIALFALLAMKSRPLAILYFLPAAAIPCLAFFATQYLAMGDIFPLQARFAESEMTKFNGSLIGGQEGVPNSEPKAVYLFHMTFGHHGIFSLTPLFLLSGWGIFRHLRGIRGPLRAFALMIASLTAVVLQLYLFGTHDYGGNSQTMRWLLWLFPLWLIFLPQGLEPCERRPTLRLAAAVALWASAFSAGFALRGSWLNPWIHDLINL